MIPKVVKDKHILVCRSCGREVSKFKTREYRITEVNRRRGRDVVIVEGEKKRTTEEERRYLEDLYGTEVYISED